MSDLRLIAMRERFMRLMAQSTPEADTRLSELSSELTRIVPSFEFGNQIWQSWCNEWERAVNGADDGD